jgi:hypothetical protein
MPPAPYEVVRSVLEAEGWAVGGRQKKVLEAERGDERLTVVISSGSAPQQIAAAYSVCWPSMTEIATVASRSSCLGGFTAPPETSGSIPRIY